MDAQDRGFFDEHQWRTVEAATSRIYPTDRDPGAREAGVVGFIDRYLSGIDYVYANPYGSGFLRLEGRQADAWGIRLDGLRATYVEGLARLDAISRERFGAHFADLTEERQDDALTELSGMPRPAPVMLDRPAFATTTGEAHGQLGVAVEAQDDHGRKVVLSQPVTDDTLSFFETLVLHTRQGFYADPAYGGNRDGVGWRVIGFDGPASIAETRDGRYSTAKYLTPGEYAVVASMVPMAPLA